MPTQRIYRKKDTYIAVDYPHVNYCGFQDIGVGLTVLGYIRALFEFDLADIPVPAGSTINSATFHWYCQISAGAADACTLCRIPRTNWLANWDDGSADYADWFHYQHDGALSWNVPGGDFSAPSIAWNLPTGTGWQVITCTAFVQDALDNRSGLIDMLLLHDAESNGNGAVYYSGNFSLIFIRPYIEVDYTSPVVTGPHLRPNKFLGC